MFRLGGFRMSGKEVWVNAWWYGAYRCTVLVVMCCSAVVKVNSDREPYLSRSSSTVHTERSKLQGWGPDRSSEHQTPDPTLSHLKGHLPQTQVSKCSWGSQRGQTQMPSMIIIIIMNLVSEKISYFIFKVSIMFNLGTIINYSKCKITITDLTFAKINWDGSIIQQTFKKNI